MGAHEVRELLTRAGISDSANTSMNYEEGGRVECWKVAGAEIRLTAGLLPNQVADAIIGAFKLDDQQPRNPDS